MNYFITNLLVATISLIIITLEEVASFTIHVQRMLNNFYWIFSGTSLEDLAPIDTPYTMIFLTLVFGNGEFTSSELYTTRLCIEKYICSLFAITTSQQKITDQHILNGN